MGSVRARATFFVATADGAGRHIEEGQRFDSRDDVVKGREDMFEKVTGSAAAVSDDDKAAAKPRAKKSEA